MRQIPNVLVLMHDGVRLRPQSQCRMPPCCLLLVEDPDGAAALNPMLVALLRSNMFAHTRANGHERIQIVIVHAAHSCSSEKHLKSSLSLQCLTDQGLPFLANEVEPV